MEHLLHRDRVMECPAENTWLAFGDGQLAAAALERIELHLDACENCRLLFAHLMRAGDRAPVERDEVRRPATRRRRGVLAWPAATVLIALLARDGVGAIGRRPAVEREDDAQILARARRTSKTDPRASLLALLELAQTSTRWSAARIVAADAVAHVVGADGDAIVVARRSAARHIEVAGEGTTIVSAADDGTLRSWNVDTGESRILGEHHARVSSLCTLGTQVVSAGVDGTVVLWSSSGAARVIARGRGPSEALACDADHGRIAASDGRGVVTMWASDGTRLRELEAPSAVCLAFSPDGTRLAAGGADHVVRVWDTASGALRELAGSAAITAVAFSPGGDEVVVGNDAGEVRRQTLAGRSSVIATTHSAIRKLAVTATSTVIALAADHVELADLDSGEHRRLELPATTIHDVAFAPSGAWLVTAHADGTLATWRDDLPRDPHRLRIAIARMVDGRAVAGLHARRGVMNPEPW